MSFDTNKKDKQRKKNEEFTENTVIENNKHPLDDTNLNVSIINEQVVNNGTTIKDESFQKHGRPLMSVNICHGDINFSYETSIGEDGEDLGQLISLKKLREVYSNSNNSIDTVYDYLKEQFLNNPEKLPELIELLSGSLLDLYDDEKHHKDFGDNAKDMLEPILQCKDEESLKGFVCMNIHEFGMKLLHDLDIPAVVLCGTACGRSGPSEHATLLYQTPDGKFIYNNYGTTMTIDAPSLIDAIKVVFKESGTIEGSGYITILDEKNSYQRFAFEQEALWSNELDKMDYNKTSPFSNIITSDKTNISGDVQVSNLGNEEAVVTGNSVCYDGNSVRQKSLSLGYKKNGETALFNSSVTVGAKAEFNGINKDSKGNETFFETKFVMQDIIGERNISGIDGVDIKPYAGIKSAFENFLIEEGLTDVDPGLQETINWYAESSLNYGGRDAEVQKSNNISTFFRRAWGKKNTIIEDENLKLDNIEQTSVIAGATLSVDNSLAFGAFGDIRTTVEDGLNLTTKGNNWQMQNNLSVGVVGDLKITGGSLHGGIQPGVKLNAGTSFVTKPTDNTTIGGNVEGHVVALKPYQDYGISGSLFASHQIAPQKTIYGKTIFETNTQNLSIGGFSCNSSDKTTFGATLGTQIKNTNINVTYKKTINGQNRTYDSSVISFGATVSF